MSSSLVWEWKQEPVSPLSSAEESLVSDDVALYGTTQFDQTFDNHKVEIEFASCESKAEVASKLLEGLEQLEDLDEFIKQDFVDEWIKDEPFSNWLEEKMLPMFEDVEPARSATAIIPAHVKAEQAQHQQTLVPDTQSLLQEFENVFDAVEMTHGTLTPPQSPPYQPLLTTLEPVSAQSVYPYPPPSTIEKPELPQPQQPQPIYHHPNPQDMLDYSRVNVPLQMEYAPVLPQTDVAHELAVVDELIRTRAEDMIQYPSSPCSNSSSSSSNFGDCSSDDPEWIPETVDESPGPNSLIDKQPAASRKRSKPYTRAPVEEKKSRKKEQNKNAATRYRMKKKAEVEEVLGEERLLAKHNDELDTKITDLQREIKYLKGLMRDLFKAKGLIN